MKSKTTFQLTAKYLVCFPKDNPSDYMLDNRVRENADHIPGPRTVNKDHPVFWGNIDNFARYEKLIDMHIFRGRGENGFVNHAMGAIDLSIRDLQDLPDPDNLFAFHNSRPCTRDDVTALDPFFRPLNTITSTILNTNWFGCRFYLGIFILFYSTNYTIQLYYLHIIYLARVLLLLPFAICASCKFGGKREKRCQRKCQNR